MIKKEMIAMLLAGGQGSRLGVLTSKVAKPAVAFGGKYRIIDFPLSNCINSGIDTVGVLTQYQPLRLNTHIGIGIPWDLDRNEGGVTVLPPYEKSTSSEWYTGTANAIFQNMDYMEQYNPDYVLILSGDHIYKMDYEAMLDYHKTSKADITLATYQVPMEEASRFGIMIADENHRITEFEEKPEHPRSNLASMGIYIFNWKTLKEALIAMADQIAEEKGITLRHGVYAGVQGPTFETPAEYRMFRIMGGDAVGMSTVPEVIVARHCGIRVFGVSIITDLGGFDTPVEVSHEEVQQAAATAQPKMTTIMREIIARS